MFFVLTVILGILAGSAVAFFIVLSLGLLAGLVRCVIIMKLWRALPPN